VKGTFTRLGLLCVFALAQGCNHRSHDVAVDSEGDAGGSGYHEETPGEGPSAQADGGSSQTGKDSDAPIVIAPEESHLEGPSASATVSQSDHFKMVSRVGIPAATPLQAKSGGYAIKSTLFSVRGKK
jgi:hypothetical protein